MEWKWRGEGKKINWLQQEKRKTAHLCISKARQACSSHPTVGLFPTAYSWLLCLLWFKCFKLWGFHHFLWEPPLQSNAAHPLEAFPDTCFSCLSFFHYIIQLYPFHPAFIPTSTSLMLLPFKSPRAAVWAIPCCCFTNWEGTSVISSFNPVPPGSWLFWLFFCECLLLLALFLLHWSNPHSLPSVRHKRSWPVHSQSSWFC